MADSRLFPKISIVVPVRDEQGALQRCLAALNNQSVDRKEYEVIVVDDGSVDESGKVAALWGARVIRQNKRGAAAARNRGVREAQGEIVLFTDADCLAEKDWVERLSSPLWQDGVHGTVGQCMSDQKHWIARLIQLELNERYSRMEHQDRIDFLNSGNCGFRRALLCDNPFDEGFCWLEDVELSFRLAQNGNRMVFVPAARVYHPHAQSLWAYMRRKFHYASYALLLYRRYPEKTFSDSRTPPNRRLQILLLVSALMTLPGTLFHPGMGLVSLGFVGGSIAFSSHLVVRAFHKSIMLGIVSPFFVLLGNLAFIAGTFCGTVGLGRSRSGVE